MKIWKTVVLGILAAQTVFWVGKARAADDPLQDGAAAIAANMLCDHEYFNNEALMEQKLLYRKKSGIENISLISDIMAGAGRTTALSIIRTHTTNEFCTNIREFVKQKNHKAN